jgi:hypothetical protein
MHSRRYQQLHCDDGAREQPLGKAAAPPALRVRDRMPKDSFRESADPRPSGVSDISVLALPFFCFGERCMDDATTGPIEQWPLGRVRPFEANAKKHSAAQIEQIAASIPSGIGPCRSLSTRTAW